MNSSPTVVAVIVNYKTADLAAECVRLVRAQVGADVRVIVVDNDSGQQQVDRLRDLLPGERIIETSRNQGFAGGVNAGVEAAWSENPDFLWVVTPDMAAQPDCLPHMLAAMQDDARLGICGPAINADGEWIVGCRLVEPLGFMTRIDTARPDAVAALPRVMPTDFVEGGAMLIRAETARDVGAFRLEFFLYYEESEYCLRARDRGWRLGVVPAAQVHTRARKADRNSRQYYLIRNSIMLARMRHRHVAAAVVRGAVETCLRSLSRPAFFPMGVRALRHGVRISVS